MKIDKTVLREADIRGRYPDQLNTRFANRLGRVFGTYVLNQGKKYCVVGHDNRFGGPDLTKALIEGLISTGINVIYIGLVTTPMLNYAARELKHIYGIMVTASHNPKEDNGFKLFGRNYQHCDPEELEFIYKALSDESFVLKKGHGEIDHIDITDSYASYLAASINPGKKPMKVVIDCGNGTASVIVRDVYKRLPFDTHFIYSDSNPSFPNHHPDPNVKDNLVDLAKEVKRLKADLGLAYDGDCDRCGFVDNKGVIVDADILMALMVKDIIANNENKTILTDVKCSNTLIEEITKYGGEVYETTPSSANQERIIDKENIAFGGGYSNHIFFHDRHPGYDDGIYVGLRVQEMLNNQNKTFNQLVKKLKLYHNTGEIKVKTTDEVKFSIVENIKKYCDMHGYRYLTIDGIKVLKKDSWALVRASNTGPNLTLRFEAKTERELKEIEKEFMDVLGILER